jgi:hypothetical protein
MDNKTKILIGVVVLIVVLFVVGTGLGVGDDANRNGQKTPTPFDLSGNNPLVQGIGNLIGAPPAIAVGDLQAPSPGTCIQGQQLVIVRHQTCQYTIGTLDKTHRLTPQVPSGASIGIVVTQPATQNPRLPDEQVTPIPGGATDHVDIYKEGGTVTITCLNSVQPACRLTLAQ